MATSKFLSSDDMRRGVEMVRLMREGNPMASQSLAELLNKTHASKDVIVQIVRIIRKEDMYRQKKRRWDERFGGRTDKPKFAPTHPLFRKSRSRKHGCRTDAMDRAVLCGGFETNRARH